VPKIGPEGGVYEPSRQKLPKKQNNYTIKGVFLGDCPIKLKLFRLFVD
jgi:hypothetical protein